MLSPLLFIQQGIGETDEQTVKLYRGLWIIEENYYLFDYYDQVLADTGKEFGIDFGKKCRPLKEIKKILSRVKKG